MIRKKQLKRFFKKSFALSMAGVIIAGSVFGFNGFDVFANGEDVIEEQTINILEEQSAGEDKAPDVLNNYFAEDGGTLMANSVYALAAAGQITEIPSEYDPTDETEAKMAQALKIYDLDKDGSADIIMTYWDWGIAVSAIFQAQNTRSIFGEYSIELNETAISKATKPYAKKLKFVLPGEHVHNWSTKWTADGEKGHYHNCLNPLCPFNVDGQHSKMDSYSAHTYGKWTVEASATDTKTGSRKRACSECGYIQYQTIPVGQGSGEKLADPEVKNPNQNTTEQKTTEQKNTDTKTPTKSDNSVTIGKVNYKLSGSGKKAFAVVTGTSDKKVTSVTIKDSVKINGKSYKVTQIAANAFKGTGVKKVVIGKNISSIGKNAFSGCKNLKNVTIKSTSLKKGSIKSGAFKGLNANAVIKVPAKNLKLYTSILKSAGFKGKKQKIKK